MEKEQLQREIERLGPWFHNLHLPDGTQTAPDHFLGDFPSYKWKEIGPRLPPDLEGWAVLDIGCNAGFYSFELARRGARVTAIDVDPHYLAQARWACGIFELEDRIDFRQGGVYELANLSQQFDLVWFMGVLYHLRYPLLALDIIRRRCKRHLLFQTMTCPGEEIHAAKANYALSEREIMNHPGWPKMAFIEHRIADDPTNWWAPNHAGVLALLRSAGFDNIERCAHETYFCGVSSPPDEVHSSDFRALPWAAR